MPCAVRRFGVAAEPRHGVLVERPQRIGRGRACRGRPRTRPAVAAGNEQQRAVDRHHLVEEHRDVHGARLRHAVVARPGAVVLVPLPDVALEGGLGVELELMDVDVLAEILLQRPDQPRMADQQAEHLAEGVRREGGARRAGLLAPDLLAVGLEDLLALDARAARSPPPRSSSAGRRSLVRRRLLSCSAESCIGLSPPIASGSAVTSRARRAADPSRRRKPH